MEGLIVLPLFLVLMWVLFVVPQQRRVNARQRFIAELGIGDAVVTAGGIHGTITDLDADTVRLEVADGVELRLARGAIHATQPSAVPEIDSADAESEA